MQRRLISDYVYFTESRSLVIELDSHEDKMCSYFVQREIITQLVPTEHKVGYNDWTHLWIKP